MADLNPAIFDLEVTNHELVKLAYDAYLANSRSSHAKTLRRGEVRGGGKSHGNRKEPVVLVSALPVTLSGATVVLPAVVLVKKTLPRNSAKTPNALQSCKHFR